MRHSPQYMEKRALSYAVRTDHRRKREGEVDARSRFEVLELREDRIGDVVLQRATRLEPTQF